MALNNNLLYTAVTHAKKELIKIVTISIVCVNIFTKKRLYVKMRLNQYLQEYKYYKKRNKKRSFS